ncbi:MAG: nicotinate-nucleotide--dimethylbenzimidazole phosphoribosyltransferase [Pseudomonadota bacterium]
MKLQKFSEIRKIMKQCPSLDEDARAQAKAHEDRLTKPQGALGRLEEFSAWAAAAQGKASPKCNHIRVAIYAGNHGIAKEGISAYPPSVTAQMVENFRNGGAAVNQLCAELDADLQVYELNLEQPCKNICHAPAMSEDSCVRALCYGMLAVEDGIDLLCLGEMGIGNTASASAMMMALHGGKSHMWVGPGTGVRGDALTHKIDKVEVAVSRALEKNTKLSGLETLAQLGGFEFAALAGAIIAARMAPVPVVLDGFACTATAALLEHEVPGFLDHCQIGHCSAEPAHKRLLKILKRDPVLDFSMRLGEGSGAVLAAMMIKSAIACHNGMATFAQAHVEGSIQNTASTDKANATL